MKNRAEISLNGEKFFNRPPSAYRKFIKNIKNCKLMEIKNQWSHRMNFG